MSIEEASWRAAAVVTPRTRTTTPPTRTAPVAMMSHLQRADDRCSSASRISHAVFALENSSSMRLGCDLVRNLIAEIKV